MITDEFLSLTWVNTWETSAHLSSYLLIHSLSGIQVKGMTSSSSLQSHVSKILRGSQKNVIFFIMTYLGIPQPSVPSKPTHICKWEAGKSGSKPSTDISETSGGLTAKQRQPLVGMLNVPLCSGDLYNQCYSFCFCYIHTIFLNVLCTGVRLEEQLEIAAGIIWNNPCPCWDLRLHS